jgi:hypothetical protein
LKKKKAYRTSTALDLRQSPFIGFLVLVKEWFNLFLSLTFTDLVCISHFKKLRCDFDKPLGFYSSDVMTVLPRRQHQFVVYQPFRVSVEKSRGRMDVDGCALDKRFVTFLWVLFSSISKEAGTDGFPNDIEVSPSRQNIVLVAMKTYLDNYYFNI